MFRCIMFKVLISSDFKDVVYGNKMGYFSKSCRLLSGKVFSCAFVIIPSNLSWNTGYEWIGM